MAMTASPDSRGSGDSWSQVAGRDTSPISQDAAAARGSHESTAGGAAPRVEAIGDNQSYGRRATFQYSDEASADGQSSGRWASSPQSNQQSWYQQPQQQQQRRDEGGDGQPLHPQGSAWRDPPQRWQATEWHDGGSWSSWTPNRGSHFGWGSDWGWYDGANSQQEQRQDKDHSKDVDPPEWDGTSIPLLTYLRHVSIWEAETKVPKEKRGLRLLAKLKGQAFDKLEMIEPEEVTGPWSMETYLQLIKDRFEPMEHRRVGKVMDDFMYKFYRHHDEEISDYNFRFEKEVFRAEQVAGALAPT